MPRTTPAIPLSRRRPGEATRKSSPSFWLRARGWWTLRVACWTRLHEAAKSGRLAEVKQCLDQGIDLNVKDSQGRSPLHYAAEEGHLQVAALLLARGAAPNLADQYNQVPLHLAASKGRVAVAELLLAHQATIDAPDKSGTTPLMLAAAAGHRETVLLLIARGADVNARDREGLSVLHRALSRAHPERAELLLAQGATPDIFTAAALGKAELVSEMLIKEPGLVSAHFISEVTPLHVAAWFGQPRVLEVLLAHHADINAKTKIVQAYAPPFCCGQ